VADIELLDIRKAGHRPGIFVIQAVARIHLKPQPMGQSGSAPEPCQFSFLSTAFGMGISPGMKLDHGRPRFLRSLDLAGVGTDEKTHLNPFYGKFRDGTPHGLLPSRRIQPSFRSQLTPPFRNQTGLGGPEAAGDAYNLGHNRHLKVEGNPEHPFEPREIPVLNVAPVLAKMGRDAVGAGLLGNQCGLDRIRDPTATGLA